MDAISVEEVLSRLTERYQSLSPRLQQVAGFIVNSPEEVPLHSMRKLAAKMGVPPSTMNRLAKATGFASYAEFREPFVQALRRRGDAFSGRANWLQHLAQRDRKEEIISGVARAVVANIESAFSAISLDELERAAEMISQARKVFVSGVGAMQYTSGFFYFISRMALDNIVYAEPIGTANFDDLNELRAGDVLFCTAFKPTATASVRTVEFAAKRGARIIVLTGSRVSPVARLAEIALIIPTDSPQFFPSQTAVMAVMEALIAVIVANGGKTSINRIETIVRHREEQGLYWREHQEQ